MKRTVAIVAALLVMLVTAPGAAAQILSNLHFNGYRITKVMPTSTRSVTGAMEIECQNDSLGFTMSNISGTVYKDGKPFLRGDLSPIKVPHGSSKVIVDCHYAALAEGINILDLLKSISFKPQDYTVDVSTTVIDTKGNKRLVAKQGVSASQLLTRKK